MDEDEKGFQDITSLSMPGDGQFTIPGHIIPEASDTGAAMCSAEILNPITLGFIPSTGWTDKAVSLLFLQENYFSRKNNVNRRFEQKLWNALRISQAYPALSVHVGVEWVSDDIFKVRKTAFGAFLNIRCLDGGLFHKQGNFPRHGFAVAQESVIMTKVPPGLRADVDGREVILMTHTAGIFRANATEEEIAQCRWDDPTPASRTALLNLSDITIPIGR